MTSAPSNSPSEPITADRIYLEQLAITLFHDAIRSEQHIHKNKIPTPINRARWVDLGVSIRKAYRDAARELIQEK